MSSEKFNIVETLSSIPVVSSASMLLGFDDRNVDPTWTTVHLITNYEGQEWRLFYSIPNNFPASLPRIHIENAQDYPPFGHINWHGSVCYKDHQGIVANYSDPNSVLIGCLMEALQTLHYHFGDITRADLFEEFEDYWESLPSEASIWPTIVLIEPSAQWTVLTGYLDHKKERKTKKPTFLAIHDQKGETNGFYWPLKKLQKKKQSKVLYLPLKSPVSPPSPLTLWSCIDIFNIIENNVDLEIAIEVRAWAENQKWNTEIGIIFSQPKPSGEQALWGCHFSRENKAKHPFAVPDNRWRIKPVNIRNHAECHLLNRGGAEESLRNKKVAVVGCGSVGGAIALNLAKSGIGELYLIDFDNFYPENIYRHVLGGLHIDPILPQTKVERLSYDIMMNHPFTKAFGYPYQLQNVEPTREGDSGFDAIVVATGDFTEELLYNKRHHNCEKPTPIIYAWQDGFGLGGHCIRVADPAKIGCLECIYTRSSGFKPHPKTSFIGQGQTITKHIGGCGGAMTPYSYLDASQTAIMATRSTIEALKENSGNELRSWKGSADELKKNGYKTSTWYEKLNQGERLDKEKYVAPNCKVCGSTD